MHKKALIVAVMLVFVASMGVASVSAQTSEQVASPTVGAIGTSDLATVAASDGAVAGSSVTASAPVVGATTYKTPTTYVAWALSQSVQLHYDRTDNDYYYLFHYIGYLRAGATGLPGQKVYLYEKYDTDQWVRGTKTTYAGGSIEVTVLTNAPERTVQFYFVFPGTGTYAGATSNVVTIKCENTKTTPYQTALFAYAKKQVVPHGTTNQMWVKLQSGATPLTGKYVYVWKWSGGRWISVSRIITRTGTLAGWALADYRLNNAGTGLYQFTFFGSSPYDRSTSNAVQLIWT